MAMHYTIAKDKDVLYTVGLCEYGHPEVWMRLKREDTENDATHVMRTVSDYMVQTKISIRPGEKIAYGCWTLRLEGGEDNTLHITEYDGMTDGFVDGATYAMTLWRIQEECCQKYGSQCQRPEVTQMIVISNGVMEESTPVQGVRYPSPSHMSGWWLTTDEYTGDHTTLKVEHVMHVLRARPDLSKYLALAFGFRFDSGPDEAWFDKKVLERDSDIV